MKSLKKYYKAYQSLTKSGIVLFVLVVGLCGYALGVPAGRGVDLTYLFVFLYGLYALSAGSLALNQVQEIKLDRKMERTSTRPLVKGTFSLGQGLALSLLLMLSGLFFLTIVSLRSAAVGLATVFLYNVFYTYIWKKKWAFGAVPGAVPGALPPVMGYVAQPGTNWLDPEVFYLFTILFLWQMPHFWILAIKLKEDYAKAGIPVLPLKLGDETTRFHMSLYVLTYLGLACVAPLYVVAGTISTLIIWIVALVVLLGFIRYLKNTTKWLFFFLSLNLSVLVFCMVPALNTMRYYL